jgi:hypothetical protein
VFEKTKARIAKYEETHANAHAALQHLRDNRTTYLVGAGCLTAGYFLHGVRAPDVVQTFANSTDNIATVINRSKNVDVVIKYLNARNYNANGCRCIETGEEWPSQIEAAIAKTIAPSILSKHLNGRFDNAKGLHFERV